MAVQEWWIGRAHHEANGEELPSFPANFVSKKRIHGLCRVKGLRSIAILGLCYAQFRFLLSSVVNKQHLNP